MKTIFDAVRLKERTRQRGRHRPAHRPDIITAPVYGRWWCPDPNTYAHLAHLKKGRTMKGRKPTAEQWERFFALLEDSGNVSVSASGAGLGRTTVYAAIRTNDTIRERTEDAKETATERLEHEARRRAYAGSDLLLIFLLKALKPSMYRDTYRAPNADGPRDFIIDLSQ